MNCAAWLAAAGFDVTYLSYYNFLLFPMIAGARMLQRVRRPDRNGADRRHDLAMPPRAVNSMLQRIFSSERYLVGSARIPFGVSLIVLARALPAIASTHRRRYHPPVRISFRRASAEALAAFAAAFAFLLALAPTAPFTRELGVCESGAVRDVLAGNIILPHFIPGPMVHVPPLYWWTAALGVHAFGWTEIALRMPSMVAAALTCAIVFMWASIAINRRTAFWAAASLLLCHFFLDAARQPRMDSMLALFVTGAAIAFERALRPSAGDDSPAPTDPRSRRIGLALAALMMGLGILTKGILGILLPGLVAGLYLVVRRRMRDLFRFDLILAFVVALAIGLSWYFAAYEVGGQKFLQWQLAMNLWSRFIPAEAGGAGYCAHPFWYFAPHTITGFIPWSVYLPAVAIYAWPRRGRKLPEPWSSRSAGSPRFSSSSRLRTANAWSIFCRLFRRWPS